MIRLVLADVDGTLVTSRKELTEATRRSVGALREAGIDFTVVSGRPPLGMRFIIKDLAVKAPIAAFNGGMLIRSDYSAIEQRCLDASIASHMIRELDGLGLEPWIYRGREWLIRNPNAPHVARERETVQFNPIIVPSFDSYFDTVVKIVGVSDDLPLVEHAESHIRERYPKDVTAARSQNYYLDITHPDANKGTVVKRLAELLSISPVEIATLGDMPSDVLMFSRSGLSFAMGNSSVDVKSNATCVVASNDNEGFSEAVRLILKRPHARVEKSSL